MRLARVTGTVTATAKDPRLDSLALLVCDLIDGAGAVTEPGCVAADTVGAGRGDTVLIAFGSAARLPARLSGAPVDAAIVGIVDRVTVGQA